MQNNDARVNKLEALTNSLFDNNVTEIDREGVLLLGEALQQGLCNNLSSLKMVRFKDIPNLDDRGLVAFTEVLHGMTSLQELKITDSDDYMSGRQGCVALANALRGIASLKSLHLSNNQIGDEGVIALAGALHGMKVLESLVLSWNYIGDEGVIALARALQGITSLRSLDLSANHIGNEGAVAMAEVLPSMRSLRSLGFHNFRIRDEGAEALMNAVGRPDSSIEYLFFKSPRLVELSTLLERNRKRNLLREDYRRVKAYFFSFYFCIS